MAEQHSWPKALRNTRSMTPGDQQTSQITSGVPSDPLTRVMDVMRANSRRDGDGTVAVIRNGDCLTATCIEQD